MGKDDHTRRPIALDLGSKRSLSNSSNSSSSSSSTSSLKVPRTPRFNEATSVHSPVDNSRSPFADPPETSTDREVGAVGFGYLSSNRSAAATSNVPMTPKSPLKSAMKLPGTSSSEKRFDNPLSPTFREEDIVEKREASTDKQQRRDLRIKTRVRMAKFALRGVSFSCSLIILSMLSASFSIFNATKSLPSHGGLPSWAPVTNIWPQILVLVMASLSLLACILVFVAYFRGGHKRAEKVATYYTLFAIGWFVLSMVLWAVSAALFQNSRNNSGNKDMWGWACVENRRSEVYGNEVDYALVCRLQNWVLICIIIEVIIEVICILLYSVVFYRYWTKRKLHKSMDMRDKARSDLYLAQLRSQSAPNTPGFAAGGPKSPGGLSNYAFSPRFAPNSPYRNLGDIEESPFTPGAAVVQVHPSSSLDAGGFRLQAPPTKAPSATPKLGSSDGFSPVQPSAPMAFLPVSSSRHQAPTAAQVADDDEPRYESVAIPGAYAGQAIKSPPATQTSFGR